MVSVKAQFTGATLQASGLTCALCAKSIYTNLTALPFVENVDTDLNASSFLISFKSGKEVSPELLRKKVEAAGFSVSNLVLNYEAKGQSIQQEVPVKIDNAYYHFVQSKSRTLSGSVQIQLIDKGFVGLKEYKKLNSGIKLNCYQSVDISDCPVPETSSNSIQSYHALIK